MSTAEDLVKSADTGGQGTSPDPERAQPLAPLPTTQNDIEEGRDSYKPGGFHPVYINDVYAEKYKVLSKIGYGVYSTVWLVEDTTKQETEVDRFCALKVLSAKSYAEDHPIFEREILKHLHDHENKKEPGYNFICHLIDDFQFQGPNGTHVGLVFELMGETLRSFGAWFEDNQLPYIVIRKFTIQLLLALDYAHGCGVIHTDIKPDNIFVKFRDTSKISDYLNQTTTPEQNRDEERYTPIQSIPLRLFYFNEEHSRKVDEFSIALGDWGVSTWADKHLTENIQPVALRAPEVLIKAPWDAKVDWWNLGALLLELYPAVRMFSGGVPPDGHYELKAHIAEIVDLFGPFPKELLERGDQNIVQAIFDDEGKVKGIGPLGRPPLESEAFMPGLKEDDRKEFGSFLRAIMKVNPAERFSTVDLLRHPWLAAME